ncbi:type II toxin-antitoxin system VapC family toxin [Candidatus Pacearchaeota archaeon]|nr:type II toxin-antitoxin system VapC family toxin [Candidatus Pacearchaeota archaeon]
MIGFDTTAIIDFFKKDDGLKRVLGGLEDDFATTIINCQETYFGIHQGDPKYDLESEFYEKFFDDIILLGLDKNSVKESSKILWELSRSGKIMGKFDCMIAGILLSNGVNKIITKNVKDFKNIKGLKVISY